MQSEASIIKNVYNIVDSIKPEAIELTNANGKPTTDREEARAVTFPYFNYGKISISIMNPNNLLVLVSPNMEDRMSDESKNRFKNFIMKIKKVGDSFPDIKFTINKVTGNDFQKHLVKSADSDLQASKEKELSMNNISEALNPMFGSSRSSYQQLDTIKMIVKHAKPVDESVKGSRTRAIKAIYLENSQGERFRLPINNLWAGRAMARHMTNNGTMYDITGQRILEWAGRIGKLQKFARYAKNNGLVNESTTDIMNAVTQNITDAKSILQQLSTQNGYASFNGDIPVAPMMKAEDERVARLKETFTVKTFDESLEDTLPLIGALIMEKEQDQSGDIFAALPEVTNELKKVMVSKKLDPKVITAKTADVSNPDAASALGRKASEIARAFTGKNDNIANFMSRMSEILDDYQNKMAFDAEKKNPQFNKGLALTQAMVNAYDLGAFGDEGSVKEVKTNNPMEGFASWATLVTEGVTVSPTSPDQQKKLNELLATPVELGEDGVNSIGSLIGIIEDDSLDGMLSELAEKDSSADARPVIIDWLKAHDLVNILEDETKQALANDGMTITEGFKGGAIGAAGGAYLGGVKGIIPGYKLGSMAQDAIEKFAPKKKNDKKKMAEREMTPGEKKKREKIVKGMKKGKAGFEKRYPGRGEEVMYATATKQAMKEAEQKGMDAEVVKILTQIYNVIKEAAPSMPQEIAGHLFNANKDMIAAINAAKTPGTASGNVDEDVIQEKNAYVMAAAAAAKAGKTEFEFPPKSGKMHKVTISKDAAHKMLEMAELYEALPVGVGGAAANIAQRAGAKLGRMATLGMGFKQATAKAQGQKEINKKANEMYLALQKVMGNQKIEDLPPARIKNWLKQNYDVDVPALRRGASEEDIRNMFVTGAQLLVAGGKIGQPTPSPTPSGGPTDMTGVINAITALYNATTNTAEKQALKKAASDLGVTLP